MTTRETLEEELQGLRNQFKGANDETKQKLQKRADEIKTLLNNLCYQCKEELQSFNEYYCSQECNDLYYRPKERGIKHDVEYMQRRLREFGRNSKVR